MKFANKLGTRLIKRLIPWPRPFTANLKCPEAQASMGRWLCRAPSTKGLQSNQRPSLSPDEIKTKTCPFSLCWGESLNIIECRRTLRMLVHELFSCIGEYEKISIMHSWGMYYLKHLGSWINRNTLNTFLFKCLSFQGSDLFHGVCNKRCFIPVPNIWHITIIDPL